MRIQVTLHLKYKNSSNEEPSAVEIARLHNLVERWANDLARRNSLESLFKTEVIDVFRVDNPNHIIENIESPF